MKIDSRLFLCCLFLLVACDSVPGDRSTVDPIEAETAAEDPATLTPRPTAPAPAGATVLADGKVVAMNPSLPLSFATSGRLLTIEVAPGDVVSPGDLIATLDDNTLLESISSAELQLALAENNLAQAQLTLDTLLSWKQDEMAVALAEANLAAAMAGYESALNQDAHVGNSLTSTRIAVEQAQRRLADARAAYETAFDPGREWELHMAEPSCLPGQGGSIPCTGPLLSARMENERAAVERGVTSAQESLAIAQANYSLAVSNLNENSGLQAAAAVASAQQALHQAQTGPETAEIDAAQLKVEQARLSRQQAQFSLDQAQSALENARLVAPWQGEVLSVDAAPGGVVGSGSTIVTLLDIEHLQFQTTNLSERDLSQVNSDQSVKITLRTYPAQTIDGTISRILPQASGQVGDAATFAVVIDLGDTDLLLLPGMTGRAEIQTTPASAD